MRGNYGSVEKTRLLDAEPEESLIRANDHLYDASIQMKKWHLAEIHFHILRED